MDLSETELIVENKPTAASATAEKPPKTRPGGDGDGRRASLKASLTRYGILVLVAVLCFSIAAFALEVWPAYEHYQSDYAQTGTWTTWFNGPILQRDQATVVKTLPPGAQAVYSLTGDLISVSAGSRTISGNKDDLRYYLAASPADAQRLFGTWVPLSTFVSGRKQSSTPVIIDQRTARRLGVGAGDTITLEVKLADEHSNEVQGRFTALVTAVARPTSQFQGVALASTAMARFVSSAQQVAATDLYIFGGKASTPQDLANALAQDQIRGARRSDMVAALKSTQSGRATSLRLGIAGVVMIVLGVYVLGELHFSLRTWQTTGKNGLFSLRRVRLHTALDALACLVVFAVTAFVGIELACALIRGLMAYEPVQATTLQTSLLFAFISLVLIVLRATEAHLFFRKRSSGAEVLEADRD